QRDADRIVDLYTELAPNFKSSVIARQVIGPYDMEQDLGLIGGNIFHGELSVDQLFHMRPAPGYADYRTPIKGLYHGSCATHAGGGVNGIPRWPGFRPEPQGQGRRREVGIPATVTDDGARAPTLRAQAAGWPDAWARSTSSRSPSDR